MSTVSNAVATRDNSPTALVHEYRDDFATVLPDHIKPDTWVRLAVGCLRRDAKLREAAANNPAALMSALLDAARQGLEPGSDEYYLTPRKVKGRLEVLGIRGYVGEIKLMYQSGMVSSVVAVAVYSGDKFSMIPGRADTIEHEIDWDAESRGTLRLVYAYARMKDGALSMPVVLNRAQINAAKKYSQGADSEYSPWRNHEEAMWLKTAIHRLRKWVPTSAQQVATLRAQEIAAEEISAARDLPELPSESVTDSEIVEAEFVGDEEGASDE